MPSTTATQQVFGQFTFPRPLLLTHVLFVLISKFVVWDVIQRHPDLPVRRRCLSAWLLLWKLAAAMMIIWVEFVNGEVDLRVIFIPTDIATISFACWCRWQNKALRNVLGDILVTGDLWLMMLTLFLLVISWMLGVAASYLLAFRWIANWLLLRVLALLLELLVLDGRAALLL